MIRIVAGAVVLRTEQNRGRMRRVVAEPPAADLQRAGIINPDCDGQAREGQWQPEEMTDGVLRSAA